MVGIDHQTCIQLVGYCRMSVESWPIFFCFKNKIYCQTTHVLMNRWKKVVKPSVLHIITVKYGLGLSDQTDAPMGGVRVACHGDGFGV